MVYGLTLYIRKYFNTIVPSNRKFKIAKNAKIANPRNINPTKIKAHTVVIVLSNTMSLYLELSCQSWVAVFVHFTLFFFHISFLPLMY